MIQVSLLGARLFLAAIFMVVGIRKLMSPEGFIDVLTAAGVPLAFVAGWLGISVELIAPLLLIIGWQPRCAAWTLAAFTVGASVIGHPFWTYEGKEAVMQQIHFLKNIAIIGGLVAVSFHGQAGTMRMLLPMPSK